MWVSRNGATLFRPGLGATPSDAVRAAVYERDQGRCRSCSVAVSQDAVVYELTEFGSDSDIEHVLCACPICAAPLHLHALTLSDAFLIWYPAVSQRVLAYLAMARYTAELAPETADAAKAMDAHIIAARDIAYKQIGTYDPAIIADALLTIRQAAMGEIPPPPRGETPEATQARAAQMGSAAIVAACDRLSGLRIWPKRSLLAKHLETYAPYREFQPAQWAVR